MPDEGVEFIEFGHLKGASGLRRRRGQGGVRGMTLYVFAPDKPNKSVCYGQCAVAWPPLFVPKGTTVPAAIPGIKGTFGVAVRTGGTRQLNFDGAPLYLWFKDKKPGDMTGQGATASGGSSSLHARELWNEWGVLRERHAPCFAAD